MPPVPRPRHPRQVPPTPQPRVLSPPVDLPSLQSAVADWLNRQDLTAQIPTFIMLAIAQFNRELRVRDMMVTADATSDLEKVALPTDWLEHYSLIQVPGVPPVPAGFTPEPLRYMSEREANAYNAGNYGQPGPPIGYTIIGDHIELVPPPTGDVNLEMVYYQRISIGTLPSAGWLIAKSPDLCLYSTLLQAEPYLKNDERVQLWASMRQSLIEAIKLESERAIRPTSGQLIARARAF